MLANRKVRPSSGVTPTPTTATTTSAATPSQLTSRAARAPSLWNTPTISSAIAASASRISGQAGDRAPKVIASSP